MHELELVDDRRFDLLAGFGELLAGQQHAAERVVGRGQIQLVERDRGELRGQLSLPGQRQAVGHLGLLGLAAAFEQRAELPVAANQRGLILRHVGVALDQRATDHQRFFELLAGLLRAAAPAADPVDLQHDGLGQIEPIIGHVGKVLGQLLEDADRLAAGFDPVSEPQHGAIDEARQVAVGQRQQMAVVRIVWRLLAQPLEQRHRGDVVARRVAALALLVQQVAEQLVAARQLVAGLGGFRRVFGVAQQDCLGAFMGLLRLRITARGASGSSQLVVDHCRAQRVALALIDLQGSLVGRLGPGVLPEMLMNVADPVVRARHLLLQRWVLTVLLGELIVELEQVEQDRRHVLRDDRTHPWFGRLACVGLRSVACRACGPSGDLGEDLFERLERQPQGALGAPTLGLRLLTFGLGFLLRAPRLFPLRQRDCLFSSGVFPFGLRLGPFSDGLASLLRFAGQGGLRLQITNRRGERDQDQQDQRHAAEARDGAVAPAPAPDSLQLPDAARSDRAVFEKALQIERQFLGGLIAVRRIARDALEHDRFQVARDLRRQLARPWRRDLGHQPDQPAAVGFGVGRPSGQQFVQRHAERIDVAARVGLALEQLGRHVAQGADHVAGPCQVLLVCELGQPEVGDPDRSLQVHQQVGWLDVPVQRVLRVCVLQRLCHLYANVRGPVRELSGGPAEVQWLPLDVLHHVEVHAVLAANAEDRHDVGVV